MDILYTGYFIDQIFIHPIFIHPIFYTPDKGFTKRYKRILINITKPWEFHLILLTLSETI